jgi:hypothetical protein
MKKTILCICLAGVQLTFSTLACGYDLAEYFPLTPGETWEYQVTKQSAASNDSWQTKTTNKPHETINGIQTTPRAYYDSGYANMSQIDDQDFLTVDDNYIYVIGRQQIGNPHWNETPLGYYTNTPPLSFKRDLAVGESWNYYHNTNCPYRIQLPGIHDRHP